VCVCACVCVTLCEPVTTARNGFRPAPALGADSALQNSV
jgi:hypothetical protein